MKHFFTLTLGRTGTKYLSELFALNYPEAFCVHEYIGAEAFGVDSPDIGTMMRFNSFGTTSDVEAFWKTKFQRVRARANEDGIYVETSHQLAKGGLLENLHMLGGENTIICLKRSLVPTALSYRTRMEWVNKTIAWLWYLDPDYPQNMSESKPLPEHGQDMFTIWYMKEMQTREAFYKKLYGDRYRFVDVWLEDITFPEGARKMFCKLGLDPPENVVIPHKSKWNSSQTRVFSDTGELYKKIYSFLERS